MKTCPVRKLCCKFTTAILAVAVLLLLCGLWWCHPSPSQVAQQQTQAEVAEQNSDKRIEKKQRRNRKRSKLRNQQQIIQQKLRKIDRKLDQIRRLKHERNTNRVRNGSGKN